jgi:hypothetical protein
MRQVKTGTKDISLVPVFTCLYKGGESDGNFKDFLNLAIYNGFRPLTLFQPIERCPVKISIDRFEPFGTFFTKGTFLRGFGYEVKDVLLVPRHFFHWLSSRKWSTQ